MLTAELLGQRRRHDLAPDVARGLEVRLTVHAARRADHGWYLNGGREALLHSPKPTEEFRHVKIIVLSISRGMRVAGVLGRAKCVVTPMDFWVRAAWS